MKTCPAESIVIAIPKGSAMVVFGRYRGVIDNAGGFPCIELLESVVIDGHVCAPHTNLYAERDSVLIGQQSGLLYGDRRLKLKDLLPDDVF